MGSDFITLATEVDTALTGDGVGVWSLAALSSFTAVLIGVVAGWGEGEVVGGAGDLDTCWPVEEIAGVEVTVTTGDLDGDLTAFPAVGRASFPSCCLVEAAVLRGF